MRGYFAIGIDHGKTAVNFGTLLRSADLLGAAFVFTVGKRFPQQASDTFKSWRRVPVFEFKDIDDLTAHLPYSCPLIGVELDARSKPIESFNHPERACYLLGAEDNGLSAAVRARCHALVQLPGERCMNVAAAGTVVMYDRHAKARPSPGDGR